MDASQLVPAKDRKLANGVRTVEDPIVTKAKAAKVRNQSTSSRAVPFCEENLSHINGRRTWPRLGRQPAQAEDLTFIVTLRRSHYTSLLIRVLF